MLGTDVNLHQIADSQTDDVSQVWFPYAYFRNEHGNVTTMFWRERLIRLKVPSKWIRRLHEICLSASGRHAKDERGWIEHKNRVEEASKGERNFATLYAMLKDNPNDPWATMYLGMQFLGALKYNEAAEQFRKFVPLCDDRNERWQALVYTTKALRMAKRYNEAEDTAFAAIREYPVWSDPYYELSAIFAARAENANRDKARDFALRSIQWYEEGVKHPPIDDDRLLKNPLDYDYNPIVTVQAMYYLTGQMEKAKELLDSAITTNPDKTIVGVRDAYGAILGKRSSITKGLDLAGYLFSHGEPLKAREVLRALPTGSAEETEIVSKALYSINTELGFTESDSRYENRYFLDLEKTPPDPDNPTDEEKFILSCLGGAKRVLDVGIGNGQTALFLAKNGIQVVGIDVDPRRVKDANLAAVKCGLLKKKYSRIHGRSVPVLESRGKPIADLPVQFWYGAVERIDKLRLGAARLTAIAQMGPFDAVLLDGLLTRVRDPKVALEAAEAVSDRVIVTVPDAMDPAVKVRPWTIRSYSSYELESLLFYRGTLMDSRKFNGWLGVQYKKGAPPHLKAVPEPAVVIWCGPGWEQWSPDQINGKGLGGSETAVVHMAEEFVRRGMRVMVYAEAEGTWNGVHYRGYDKWNPQMPVWMFIAWRNPAVFDAPIQADLKYLWLHDVDCGPALTKERAEKIDDVLVLSRWHRSHVLQKYPFLEDATVIGNGIVPERFKGEDKVRESRILYSSSPDRGLEQALAYWPQIRKKTGAEFHIFYGFNNFALMGGDPTFRRNIEMLAEQDGVVWRGRVPQDQLAKEMMRAKVLLYPGPHPFEETFCITALEAQAAGCVPVTRNNGALSETNKHGIVLPNDSKPSRWVAAVQEALNTSEHDRSKMREWALGQTWEVVANRVVERSIEIDAARQQQESHSA